MPLLHQDEFKAGITDEQRASQLVTMTVEEWERSTKHYYEFRTALQQWYDIVRGYWQAMEGIIGFNDVPIPFLFSMLQSSTAKKLMILFGERPYCQFLASGQLGQAMAKKRSKLIEAQFDACKGKEEIADINYTAELYGSAIARYHWRRDYGDYWQRERTWWGTRTRARKNPRTGMMGIKFDGPDFYNVDPIDFGPWPGVHKLRNMYAVTEQMFMDFEDIVVGSERGPDGEEPIYDPKVVNEMRYSGGAAREASSLIEQRLDMASGVPLDRLEHMRTSWAKPVWILERSGRVPRGLAVWDPETKTWCNHVHTTVANGKHLLRCVPIPHWDREAPYHKHSPIVDPHFFWAPGKVEIGMRLQAAINKYVSRGMDFLDLYLDPVWVHDLNSNIDPEQLFTGPGNVIGAEGPIDDKALRQFSPDLRGYQVNLQQVGVLWQWLQQALGMSADISLGAGEVGSDRQTAHEWVGRERAIDLRLRLELFKFEEEMIIPLWQKFVQMDRQWLSFPAEIDAIGTQAIWDDASAQFLAPMREEISLEEMRPDLDIRPIGVTRQLSLQTRMANVERVMPLLGPFLPALNMRSFIADILPLYGFYDVESKLNTEEQMRMAIATMLATGTGEGGKGAGAKSPGTPSPDRMGA